MNKNDYSANKKWRFNPIDTTIELNGLWNNYVQSSEAGYYSSLTIKRNTSTLTSFDEKLKSIAPSINGIAFLEKNNDAVQRPKDTANLTDDVNEKTASNDVNAINLTALNKFKKDLSGKIILALRDDPIEPGVEGFADEIFRNAAEANQMAAYEWLSHLFLTTFSEPSLCASIVLLAGRIKYEDAKPIAITIAVGALSHKDTSVKEAGVRAFENWGAAENIEILENIDPSPVWLKEYVASVIKDLKSNSPE